MSWFEIDIQKSQPVEGNPDNIVHQETPHLEHPFVVSVPFCYLNQFISAEEEIQGIKWNLQYFLIVKKLQNFSHHWFLHIVIGFDLILVLF
jgi:hypothetical protein